MPQPCMQLFGDFNEAINKFGPPPSNTHKPPAPGRDSLVIDRGLKWIPETPNGTINLTVKFLEKPKTVDPDKTIAAIKAAATEWEKHANIKFQWKELSDEALIRIAFQVGGGYQSKVGSKAHLAMKADQTSATMNLDFRFYDVNKNKIADNAQEIYGTTLHEFGHAIGCCHEQVNPDIAGQIVWNPPVVYDWFWNNQTPRWDKDTVDLNFNKFEPMAKDAVFYTKWDKTSIMQYFILKKWTKNLTEDIPEPKELSQYDKSFIAEMYPFPKK